MLRKRIHQRDGRGANLLTVHLGPGLACAWVFLWSWRHQPGGGTSHGHNAALILLTSMVTDHYSRCFPWKGSSVQSLRRVRLFAAPLTAAHQPSLSITNSRSILKLMSVETAMPSNHLILRRPLLLQPSVFPSIRVFSNESALRIRWPKYWSFSFCISPSND